MTNQYFDIYIDDDGNKDTKPTLNSDGFAQLTEDLEELVTKFTGIDADCLTGSDDDLNNIRLDLMEYLDKKVSQWKTLHINYTSQENRNIGQTKRGQLPRI